MNNLYGWVFTKNTYTNKWRATNRDNLLNFWDNSFDLVIESSDISTLIEIIEKNDGDIHKVMLWKKNYD